MAKLFSTRQQIRTASVGHAIGGTANETVLFPMSLGQDEVALVKAVNWCGYPAGTGSAGMHCHVMKRHDNIPAGVGWPQIVGDWQYDPDILDSFWAYRLQFTAVGNLDNMIRQYKVLPDPVVVIRPPVLAVAGTGGGFIACTLHYSLYKVAEKELAQLLVKDHA